MITCTLDADQIKDLRIYNIAKLKDVASKSNTFDLVGHIQHVYDLVYENTNDHNVALDYARLAVVLTSTAAFNVKSLRVLANKGLDYTALVQLALKVENEETGLQETADFLGIDLNKKKTAEIVNQIIETIKQVEKVSDENSQNTKTVSKTFTLKPLNPVSTTIDETVQGTETDMAYYTTFVKDILNNASITGETAIPYPGVEGGLILKLVPHNRIPVEQLHDNIKAGIKDGTGNTANHEHYSTGYVFVITDVNGKEILFDQNYNVTDTGKMIYFKSRFLPAKAEGQYDLTNLKNVQSPAEIAKNTGLTIDEAKEYLQNCFTLLGNAYSYLQSNPEGSIKFFITGGSLGAVVDAENTSTFTDIKELKAPISRVYFPSKEERKSTAFSGFYLSIGGVDYAIKMKTVSAEDANMLADLLLSDEVVSKDGKVLSMYDRRTYFHKYISPAAKDTIGFRVNKETKKLDIVIFKDGKEVVLKGLPETYQQDKNAIVEALQNTVTASGNPTKRKYTVRVDDFNENQSVTLIKLEDTETGKRVIETPFKGVEYFQQVAESINAVLDSNGVPERRNGYFTVRPVNEEVGKFSLNLPAAPAKVTPTDAKAEVARLRAEEVVQKAAPQVRSRRTKSSADNDILNQLKRKDFKDKNKLDLQQSVDATVEQIAAAKAWYEKSPLSKHVPFEVMFNAVNIKVRGSIATWNIHGITLWKGSDYSDLYHEAWHGFTQMFMTQAQRDALYAEARKQDGTFTNYLGNTVAYSEATDDELEEKMAEDFREYMLKKQSIAQPVKKSFFQKIWDLLKALFGKSSTTEAVDNFTGNPVIDELYQKLRVGNLTQYTFNQANYQGKSYQSRRNSGITNQEDLQLMVDSIDSLFAEASRDLNAQENTKIYTSAIIKDKWARKIGYRYVLDQFTNRLQQLLEDKEAMGPEDVTADIDYDIDLLTKAIVNFGNIDTLSGGLIEDHMNTSRLIAFEDRLMEEELDVTKKNEFQSKAGNEVGMQELADATLLYSIRSLRQYNAEGQVEYNRLGFDKMADFDQTWKRITNITKGARNVSEIYNKLQAVSNDYPVIKEFLDNVGNPLDPTGVGYNEKSTQNLWTEIGKIFTMPEIKLMSVQVKMKEEDLPNAKNTKQRKNKISYVTPTVQTGENKKIGDIWNNAFATALSGNYIKKTAGKINTLNLALVMKQFPNVTKSNAMEFMAAVGMPLENTSSAVAAALDPTTGVLSNIRAVHEAIKAIYQYNTTAQKKIEITRPTSILKDFRKEIDSSTDKVLQSRLSGSTVKMNKILDHQLGWSDAVTSSTVTNPSGESQDERSLPSTISNRIGDINAAESITQLTQAGVNNAADRSMGDLDKDRNPFMESSQIMMKLFDEQGNKRKNERGEAVKFELHNMAGVSVLQEDVNGLIESSGISTSNSDFISRYLNEFLMTMLHGASVATQHADKSTAYLYRVVDSSGNPHYIRPADFTSEEGKLSTGESRFISMMMGYLSSEFERIGKLQTGDPSGNVTVGKKTYRETGSEFVIFDKILSAGAKGNLKSLIAANITTAEQLNNYLDSNVDLKQALQKQIHTYLWGQARTVNETLDKIGVFDSQDMMNALVDKMGSGTKLNIRDERVRSQLRDAIAVSFAANSWIHKYESTIMLYGDPALFAGVDDFFKRNAGAAATGTFPRTDDAMQNYINQKLEANSYAKTKYGVEPRRFGTTMNSAVLEDTKTNSTYFEEYVNTVKSVEQARLKAAGASKEIIEGVNSDIDKIFNEAYAGMKEGDGQGWINIDAYRSLLMSMNKWSTYQEELYVKIIKGEDITADEIKQFMPVKKMQYWGPLDTNGLPVLGFHKFSLMPLIPNMIKGTNLEILQEKMLRQEIDYALFQSGSKVNTITTNGKVDKFYVDNTSTEDRVAAFADPKFTFTKNTIFLRYFKDQVEVQDTYKGKTTFSSQMRKLIEYGLVENGVPTDWNTEITNPAERIAAWDSATDEEKNKSLHYNLYTEYEKTLNDYIQYEMDALRKEIGGNQAKLLQFIRKELTRKDLADHTIDFIDIDPATNKFKYDLDFSLDADNIEKMLVALVQKRLINHKFKGEGLIQVSGAGFEKTNRTVRAATDEELKRMATNELEFYSNDSWSDFLEKSHSGEKPNTPSGKNTKPIGVMISMQGDFKKLLKLKEVKDLATANGISALDALNILIKDEVWLNKGENRKLVTSMAVRIPVQGLNSMEYMQIREFLPESSGNMIVLPAEIVAKSGGDFDIDKMFTLFPNIKSKTLLSPETLDIISEELGVKVDAEMMNAILDKKDDNEPLTEQEEKAYQIFEEAGYELTELSMYSSNSKKGYQNRILELATEILSLDYNFPNLVTPNTTITMKTIADEMAEKTRGVKGEDTTSPTEIFEVLQNVNKHQANMVGKTILGIIAVSNTFNTIFDRTGLLLSDLRILNPSAEQPALMEQRLLLDHNNINGQISLSSLYSKDGSKRIADLISQLINGSVDVAKGAWIFDIQGNKELINSLVFMVMAGVDPRQAINFISQPIISDYVDLQKRYKSTFSVPLDKIDHENLFRIDARDKVLFDPQYGYGLKESDYPKPKGPGVNKGTLFTDLSAIATRNANLITPENLKKNIKRGKSSKGYTDVDKAVFAHFLEIQEMANQITQITQNLNFDTTQTKTLFDARAKMKKIGDLTNGIDEKYIDAVINNSPIGAFTIQPFIRELFHDLFPLRDNEKINNYIDTWYEKTKEGSPIIYKFKKSLGIEDDQELIRKFRTDLISFIFQNSYYSFDPNTSEYNGQDVNYQVVEQLKLNTIAGVKNGVLYVDKARLEQSFTSGNYKKEAAWQQYDVAPVDPNVFEIYDDSTAKNLYTKFVYERETVRSLPENSFDTIKDSAEFKAYYNDLVKLKDASPEKKAYEYVIRNKALSNLNLHVPMFYGSNAYGLQVMELEKLHPELEKYSLFKVLQADTAVVNNKQITNLKFAGRPTTSQINRIHEDLLELANSSVAKVSDPVENERISKLFQKFTHFAILQSGIDQRSAFSMIKAVPLEHFIALVEGPRKQFLEELYSDKGITLLKNYKDQFAKQYSKAQGKLKNRIKNYAPVGTKATDKVKVTTPQTKLERVFSLVDSPFEEVTELVDETVGSRTIDINGVSINLDALGISFDPNDQQLDALDAIAKFIDNKDVKSVEDQMFVLMGYAGTGKSSITKIILKYLDLTKKSYEVTAPTHKAKGVIAALTNKPAKTIQANLNLKPNIDIENIDLKDLNFIREQKDQPFTPDILIIDETSFVGEGLYEYIKKFAEDSDTKVLFIGDPAQLKPVEKDERFAGRISPTFNLANKIELTKVERQKGSNPLGPVLDAIRSNITSTKDTFPYTSNILGNQGVGFTDSLKKLLDQASNAFLSDNFKNNRNFVRILAYTNKRVGEYNEYVRKKMGYTDEYVQGELLMASSNVALSRSSGEYTIKNSVDYEVESIQREDNRTIGTSAAPNIGLSPITLNGFRVKLNELGTDKKSEFFIISRDTPEHVLTELAEFLDQLVKKSKLNSKLWQDYYNIINSILTPVDINTKSGRTVMKKSIDYGYSHTVHKSQGVTYTNAIVDMDDINRAQDLELRNQMKYVALSRATNMVYAVSSKAEGLSPDINWNMDFTLGTPVKGKSEMLTKQQQKRVSKADMETLDKFSVSKNTETGIHSFKVSNTNAYNESDVKKLALDYPGGLFLVNGFVQDANKKANTAGTNSVFLAMGPESVDYVTTKFGAATRFDKSSDAKNFMTDATYEENVKAIDEDLARWEESDKVLIFDEMGYGQYMMGINDITGEKVSNPVAPRTFQYLSSQLLSKFGYVNPNYLSTPQGVKDVQKYQYVSDDELIEQKKVCKLQ